MRTRPAAASMAGWAWSARAGSASRSRSWPSCVYVWSNPHRYGFYDHFVWQAQAWLDGSASIRYPVSDGIRTNDYYQDVLDLGDAALTARFGLPFQPGHALLPFPPLPAVLLLPFVAVWGLATSGALVAAVLGGINVGLCWRMLTRVTDRRGAAFLGTITYGFGTVAWYASMLGTTWFQAHVLASTLLFLSITAALDAERREAIEGAGRAIVGRHPGPRHLGGRPARDSPACPA